MGSFFRNGGLARYPWRRLAAWFIDLLIVSLIVAFAFGDALLGGDPLTMFRTTAASALIGAVYFFVFANLRVTPGLALMRGSLSSDAKGRIVASALFGAMLLPLGMVLLVLEPAYDIYGAFGVEVSI
jgi:hypothetical protein